MKRFKTLARLELCNFFGLNVLRHTKDPKERRKMLILYGILIFLVLLAMGFTGIICFAVVSLGMGDAVPVLLTAAVTVMSFMFGIFKAGGTIFRKNGYDVMSALPLSDGDIVLSRVFRLYAENTVISLIFMLPGFAVYMVMQPPGVMLCLSAVFTTLLSSLIPAALSAVIGTLILGAASHMKHKAAIEVILSVVLVLCVFGLSAAVSTLSTEINEETLKKLIGEISAGIESVYPPAAWLGKGAQGDMPMLLLFAGVSLAAGALAVTAIIPNYHGICRRLFSISAKHDFTMSEQRRIPVMRALIKREARHYFSSGVYVTNTVIAPVLALVMSIVLIFADLGDIMGQLPQLPFEINIFKALPFTFAAVLCMANTTPSSLSIEGKSWWLSKTLPLDAKSIFTAKTALGLCIIAPFYAASEVILMFVRDISLADRLWLVLVPAAAALLSCTFGVFVNIRIPKLKWENEVQIIKQSAATAVGGMLPLPVYLILGSAAAVIPQGFSDIFCAAVCAGFLLAAALLYVKICGTDIKEIN